MKRLVFSLFFLAISLFSFGFRLHDGLYGIESPRGLFVNLGTNYYFGDMELKGFPNEGTPSNISYYAQVGYRQIGNDYFSFRYSVLGGQLRGDRSPRYNFSSIIVEPSFVVEYYPFISTVNLYLFAGAGMTYSHINTSYLRYNESATLNTFSPIIPVGGGYQFRISQGMYLGFELSYRFAILETPTMNLDGYPFYTSTGQGVGITSSKWADGYYTLGVTFTWDINNYSRY